MRAAEEAAFARGIEVEALMDQAATRSWRPNVCNERAGRLRPGFLFPKTIAVN
jgi:hypothetical protein